VGDLKITNHDEKEREVFFVVPVAKKIKIQIPAGQATPAPPVGTVLGPAGINLQEFCTRYNDATKDKQGDVLPVEITVYEDRTFDFIIKIPPAAFLIKKAANVKKGSNKGKTEFVGSITPQKIREIAEIKLPDLNAYNIDDAIKIIEGTALNMGIEITEGQKEYVVQEKYVVEEKPKEVTEEVKEESSTEETE